MGIATEESQGSVKKHRIKAGVTTEENRRM